MDTPELPLNYFEEGERYLQALEALGLSPAALFWAFDRPIDTFVLVMISEEYDYVGPLALSRMLFKAYDAAATPRAIDPFIIRMHSPNHQIVREMDMIMPLKIGPMILADGSSSPDTFGRAVITVGGLEIDGEWVFRFNKPLRDGRKSVEVLRRWHRFERNVEAA